MGRDVRVGPQVISKGFNRYMAAARNRWNGDADGSERLRKTQIVPFLVLVCGATAGFASWRLSVGELTNPGPGLWPFAVSFVIVVTSVLLLARDTQSDYERLGRESWVIAVAVSLLVAFIWALDKIGFTLAGFLLLGLWLKVFGKESWRRSLAIALIGTIAIQVLFVRVLAVPLPITVLGEFSGGRP